ncbi:MAG: hypothetical protein AAF496_01405, partial [Pseudomonadota bacterium]
AMGHIDTAFTDDDARGTHAERAEKTLQPVVEALAHFSGEVVTQQDCQQFLADPSVFEFPWTAPQP